MICSVLGVPQEDWTEPIGYLAVGAGDGTATSPEYLSGPQRRRRIRWSSKSGSRRPDDILRASQRTTG